MEHGLEDGSTFHDRRFGTDASLLEEQFSGASNCWPTIRTSTSVPERPAGGSIRSIVGSAWTAFVAVRQSQAAATRNRVADCTTGMVADIRDAPQG